MQKVETISKIVLLSNVANLVIKTSHEVVILFLLIVAASTT